jgi:Flp pilus assembly protein TadG
LPSGKILVVTGLMLVALIGFAAVAVDIGVIAAARAQLKTVADSGALAGAQQLVSDNRLKTGYTPTTEAANASANAISMGQLNTVLNQNAVVLTTDVKVGYKQTYTGTLPPLVPYYDATDATWKTVVDSTTNSIQVTAARDASHVAPVPAFFSRIWGSSGKAASVTSTATAEIYSISGFTPGSNPSALLPITLSKTAYQDMMQYAVPGTTIPPGYDNFTYTPPAAGATGYGTVTGSVNNPVPDGVPETVVYPVNNSGPGNWGTINVGVTNNSTSTLRSQIENGITPAQMTAAGFPNPPSTFSGNPGISSGISSALSDIIGKPLVVPLWSGVSGNGNNLTYTMSEYVGVRIMAVDLTGNPKYVIVQPALVGDPTANPGTPQSSFTSGGVVRLHLSR